MALGRYGAASEIAGWFLSESQHEYANYQEFLGDLKEWLENIYLTGNTELRTAIVTGALEHILEQPRWRKVFEDWRDHPILCQAYREAMEWAEYWDTHEIPDK